MVPAQEPLRRIAIDGALRQGSGIGKFQADFVGQSPGAPTGRVGHQDADVPAVEPARFVRQAQPPSEDAGHLFQGLFPASRVGHVYVVPDSQGQERQGLSPAIGACPLAVHCRAELVRRVQPAEVARAAPGLE